MPNLNLLKNSIWAILLLTSPVSAQTIFTFGKHKVSRDEFVEAYQKNNRDTSGAKMSYADYLDLYIRFKLKVQDALDAGFDTTASQKEELKGFRYQLAENYMREDASIDLLVNEAAERMTKDVKIVLDNKEPFWITAFVLPYEMENIAYSGGNEKIKKIDERAAAGQISIAQILLYSRPAIADSLYGALQNGASFETLAEQFSDDNLTYKNGGKMPPFGVGKYVPEFENAAFALEKDGDISRPVKTSFGYHILKRLARIPVRIDKNEIREQVMSSDRMAVARQVFVKNVKQKINKPELASDTAVLDYYRDHLEDYNAEFAAQLNEFRQGNLLFAVMQQKIWDRAGSDSVGLLNFYNAHPNNYYWENSADALVITPISSVPVASIVDSVKQLLAADGNGIAPGSSWRQIMEASNGEIIIDSGRFEMSQIPDTVAIIIKKYPGRERKSFEEARGAVINDYQQFLEEQWLDSLRKKYPVRINRKALKKL